MKILVTGSNGLLGQHLIRQLLNAQHQVAALGRGPQRVFWQGMVEYRDFDITRYREMQDLILRERPDVLVHSAAMTQVDDCEKDRAKCREVNVTATENLLEAAAGCGSHFIFLSTDFVFDGNKGNYREEDIVNPVNWYGQTKVEAEQLIKQYPYRWSVARTCLLYGISKNSSRTNIISWIKSALEKGEQIRVVNDQVRTPTDVKDFARGIEKILHQGAAGFFHLSGDEVMTPYQLALATADFFSLDKSKIGEVNSNTFSQVGKRPLKTGFDISKARQVLGFAPGSLQEGLEGLINEAM
ncbi:MAG: NAD(P)-dependent oxidoreductase [Bacteroidota bacterium]|nr:NAD(P)-dependent oxidoreductase [Bacteroidota bacterium]MDP4213215.1 NAD(P)-dependent oxidoreductase [Bacteroidota bacterium]MDP4250723.1 NAD(P)-dependent oxidoreductase [Bacteroidota bacterium]